MCYCTRVILVHYRTDDTCTTVHVRRATTDRNTRALPTRGHARPRVHLADRRITNLCAHRSLCYSTRARWLHVGTPAHVCTVHGRSVLNFCAPAGRYTTLSPLYCRRALRAPPQPYCQRRVVALPLPKRHRRYRCASIYLPRHRHLKGPGLPLRCLGLATALTYAPLRKHHYSEPAVEPQRSRPSTRCRRKRKETYRNYRADSQRWANDAAPAPPYPVPTVYYVFRRNFARE